MQLKTYPCSCVTIHVTILSLLEELPSCLYRFPGSTLRMSTIAGDCRAIADAFTVGTAIFATLWHRALTTRMGTFVDFLFGHESLLLVVTFRLA